MAAKEKDITVSYKAPKTKRILAFDLIRGFFLLVIMVDHVELYPNGFDIFTGKGRLWVSAAEGFFFLSGLLIGMMYKRRLALGMKFIFKKMWTRALELYVVGVGLTFIYLAWAVFTHHSAIKDLLPFPFPWNHYIKEALLMRFTYGWADFLVRFAILMFMAPFVFFLVAKRLWWLALAATFGVWLFRGMSFTLAWQLIFNLGIIIGFYWQPIQDRFRSLKPQTRSLVKRSFAITALITLALSYATVFVLSLLFHLWGDDLLSHWWQHVAYDWGNWNYDVWKYTDKWTMGPIRAALFFIWFPVLYWVVRRYEDKIGKFSRGILELLGQNSLFVYTVHSVIVFTFKMYLIPSHTNFFQNFLITGLGLVLLVSTTKTYVKHKSSLLSLKDQGFKLSFSASGTRD
jgi:hypothetical protein